MKITNYIFKFSILLVYIFMSFGNQTVAQTQRNPVLEECTGTWCQWCPCGHDIMEGIKESMPNAILIGYHGPANGSDPYSFFPGNQILSLMGFSGYPTAVIDRTGPPISRGSWPGAMNQRFNVPATVGINIDKSFNKVTRELNATVNVTALEDLTGDYKMTMILLENGLLHSQAGNSSCPGGGSNYVHNHVVRAIINGAQGEELNAGNPWNTGEVISKPVQYLVPAEIEVDSSYLVVMVNKVQSPFNSGEIQQAEEWTLVSPDYVATISSTSEDIINDNVTPAEFTTVVRNEGLLDDMYYVDIMMDSPNSWSGEYTTANGTFPFEQQDLIDVSTGDSAVITLSINPNGIDGYGNTQVQFSSMNDPGVIAIANLRNITTTGVEVLVVDASAEEYGTLVSNSLDGVYEGSHGMVSRNAITASVDLSNFYVVTWSAGNDLPAFYPEEVTVLESYLDSGGNLFINGQNIGSDIFEPNGQSQFAQDFYNNYLHADYLSNSGSSFILQGYDGDPITDGIMFVIGDIYERSADEIAPIGADATPILKFLNNPDVNSIKVSTNTNRIIYLGIGFEQLSSEEDRDTIMARSINWLTENIVVGTDEEHNSTPNSFSLDQNYPNPFNPSTRITYSVPQESYVTIKVYDLIGQEVAVLVDDVKESGYYQVTFDAFRLSSGVYIYEMRAGDFSSVKKMSILK